MHRVIHATLLMCDHTSLLMPENVFALYKRDYLTN